MKSFFAALVLAAAVGVSAPAPVCAQALPSNSIDTIVAVVEDDVILRSELDRATTNIINQFRGRNANLPPRAELERQVLERLILIRLQILRANASGVRVSDTELDQAVLRLAQQNNVSLEQMRAALERDGSSYEEFRQSMREEMLVGQLRRQYTQSRVHITDTEVDLLLASNTLKRGEVHLGHILIGIPDGGTAEQIQAARDKATQVEKEIAGGLDFASAAVRYSSSQEALEGGDLGWRRLSEVPSAFSELVAGLKPGEVTQPLRGPTGFHILKLLDQREEGARVAHEYHARHIMIRNSEVTSSEEAHSSISNLRDRIAKGEDFAALAKKFSEDVQSANLGGDLGWFEIDAFGTQFSQILSTLKDDELSQPFQTGAGWHIVQRLGTRDQDRTAESLREEARQTLMSRKADEAFEAFLHQIRSEGFVESRLTGAAEAKS